jgi:cobalt-zinc-cadmium efflux system outer membrane protein
MWGSIEPEFQQAVGDFDTILELPPALELLQLQIASNPDLARGQSEILMQQAALDSALAERYPDLKVAAGVKRFEEDETHALIFGFGVPLPLFNRNQGNISAARDELAKAQAMERATAIRLASELAATHARLTSAHSRVRTLSTKVIPALEESYAATHQGYQQGKYGILEVLDAQRHLFTTKNELIDALAVYHTALTDIERLTGMKTEYQDFKM